MHVREEGGKEAGRKRLFSEGSKEEGRGGGLGKQGRSESKTCLGEKEWRSGGRWK